VTYITLVVLMTNIDVQQLQSVMMPLKFLDKKY
jgi:hypothetical protein